MLKYRPDIDGLRALAVLPVVLFHADIPGFSGGFVGVDIFFVISGFLITSLLLTELQSGQFSLRRFYIRRARRLFPALVAVVAVTLLVGFFLLPSQTLYETARAARHIAIFLSNHFFWLASNDYWMQNTLSIQPLLHSWSLAVEEQFYLIIPGLLLFCFWLGKQQGKGLSLILLSGLFLASLIISQWLLGSDSSAAFYLLPPRAWELLSGTLLVFIVQRKQIIKLPPIILQMVGTLGLVLIGYSIFFYNKETPFPGLSALTPCLGAALIIYTGSQPQISWVNHLLKKRLLVFIGLISYSLYLWHWPVLVLYRSPNWMAYDLPVIPVWLLLSFVLLVSWASWRWIEQPFRKQASKQASKQAKSLSEWQQLGVGLIALAFCWSLGAAASQSAFGKFHPVPEVFREIYATAGERCEGVGKNTLLIKSGTTNCILGDVNSEPSFFVLGDSHARMWTSGLDVLGKEHKFQGIALSYSGCTPIFDYASLKHNHCPKAISAAIEYITESSIKNIILIGRWSAPLKVLARDDLNGSQSFYEKLSQVLEKLTEAGKTVYFIHDIPELESRNIILNKLLEAHNNSEKNVYVTIPSRQTIEHQSFINSIKFLQEKYYFSTLDPIQQMLDISGKMLLIEQSHPIYYDADHLTDYGSIRFREVFLPLIQDILAKQQTDTPENTQPVTLQ